MKKKGFTLVELIAVIALVGALGLLVIPNMISLLENSRKKSFKTSVQSLLRTVEINPQDLDFESDYINVTNSNIDSKNVDKFENGFIRKTNNVFFVYDITDGEFCATGTRNNLIVKKLGECSNLTLADLGVPLLPNTSQNYSDGPWAYKDQIESIDFNKNINVDILNDFNNSTASESAANLVWDISKDEKKKLIAYLKDDNNNGLYELHFAAKGEIYGNYDMSYMFYNFSNLIKIDTSGLNTTLTKKMISLFDNDKKLEIANVSKIDTSNVTDFSKLFRFCNKLKSVDLSNWDTSKATHMTAMFQETRNLTTLNLKSFNTINVTDMSYMFMDTVFSSINISSFNTSNVQHIESMFKNNENIISLNLSKQNPTENNEAYFDTSNVNDMSGMFEGLKSLKELGISSFNTTKVNNMERLFKNDISLTSLNLSDSNPSGWNSAYFDTAMVTNMKSMFEQLESIQYLNISTFDTSNVKNMSNMFSHMSYITVLDLSNFDTSNVTTFENMFNGSSSLTNIIASNKWIINDGANITNQFTNCGTSSVTKN